MGFVNEIKYVAYFSQFAFERGSENDKDMARFMLKNILKSILITNT